MRGIGFLVLHVLALVAPVHGAPQAPVPLPAAPARPVYVRPFDVFVAKAEDGGRLARRREARQASKAREQAVRLANGIATDFSQAGYRAAVLPDGAPLPADGWLVRGAWYALDAQGRILEMPRVLGGEEAPNVEVSVSVADLAVNPSVPFVVFGRADALRGQGAPVGWNPWVVASKFVLHEVQEGYDLDALAKQIVETILENRETVAEKARAAKAP